MPGDNMDYAMANAHDGVAAPAEEVTYEPYTILEQHVQLDLNFRGKQFHGTTYIRIFKITNDDLEYINLDARQCEIDLDKITVNNQKVKATYRDPYEFLDTPEGYTWNAHQHHLRLNRMKPMQPKLRGDLPMTGRETKGCQPANGALRVWLRPEKIVLKPVQTPGVSGPQKPLNPNEFEITIPFRVTQVRDGLHFVGVDAGDTQYPHVYTRHSIEPGYASSLFPCVDDRTRIEKWEISLKFPRTVGDALKQPLASHPGDSTNGGATRNQQPRRDFETTEEDKLLDMTAICSGTLVGEKEDPDGDVSKKVMTFNAKHCGAQHIGFAVGPFEDVDLYSAFRAEEEEVKLGGNAVKVHGYCLPGRSDEVRNTCQPLAHATDFFTLTFSKYPYDENSYKICFVEEMVDDIVPMQAFSLCSNRLLYPADIIDTEVETTRKLVHSLASQYFGIFINPNEWTDTWIVVGLAYFMTDLYLRQLCGNNYYRFQIRTTAEHLTKVDHGRPSLHELGRYLHLGEFEMDFMTLKAPLVIFILDRRLLKSSNSAGVVRVISQRLRDAMQAPDSFAANFVVSSDQFRRNCERKGRLRLESFWDQWVYSSGCPRLHITQRFNKKRLEVELTVVQNQVDWAKQPHPLQRDDFWRDVVEERQAVLAAEVPLTFTGPMTFRVHEADGTPYEHCLEMKLDAAATKGSRLAMPYNTKYKRIKRVRQKKREKEHTKAPGASRGDLDGQDEDGNDDDEKGHTLNMFGDVLLSPDDMDSWKLVDWDEDQQQQMDQESYEWIRVDCDFEWIYYLDTNLKVYMTVAQLQQDRDIAAQVESMLQLTRNQPSNIQTTTLLRTLYDDRYFYGIRTMAAQALTGHAERANNFRGMHHLLRVFKAFYCYPDTSTPRPNDFSDKKSYHVQAAIPAAVARVRGDLEFCPTEAREFILDQLIYNNNDENPFSDHFYIAKLLEALAISMVRAKIDEVNNGELDAEMQSFVVKALEQIDRYKSMDEVFSSYQNIWTRTALDCKVKLMKSGIIPIDGVEFMQYLTPDTLDVVQIKAFECMIELGLFLKPVLMKFLFTTMSLSSSPFVRDRLFKAFTRGLASIAFGEYDIGDHRATESVPKPNQAALSGENSADTDNLLLDEEDNGGLIVEHSDAIIQKRKSNVARRHDIAAALRALKEALQDNEDLQKEMWKAIDSPVIGLSEKRNLMELCSILFRAEDEMLVTMQYPVRWSVTKGHYQRGKSLVMDFKRTHKTSLGRKRDEGVPQESAPAAAAVAAPASAPPPPPRPAMVLEIPPRTTGPQARSTPDPAMEQPKKKLIKLLHTGASRPSMQSPTTSPAPMPRQPSISVATPSRPPAIEKGDSIAVQNRTALKPPSTPQPVAAAPATEHARPSSSMKPVVAKTSKKRKLGETETPAGPSRPRKIVTLRYNKFTEERRRRVARIPSSGHAARSTDSIVATPAARAFAAAASPSRKGSTPANVDVSMGSSTSTPSASSSSNTQKPQQKTPLPNGKIRRPLPTGPSPNSSGSPTSSGIVARPSGLPRQHSNPQKGPSASPSRRASPVASRSSAEPSNNKPKKIIKLKLGGGNKDKGLGGLFGGRPKPPPPPPSSGGDKLRD
ncbi:Transcription initiation factor TFIID subunit 2 [Cytospora mali]|uniref:Transcription initiation factor TFIID subunit 2 n=1 Tax=Cytospora mali TaxID=578113 RepID=A0A194UZL8_CYTMA|nr:Transcription initiation factor TFIID subunit 2 [Valsa mali var. pyri (nom. inval.)]